MTMESNLLTILRKISEIIASSDDYKSILANTVTVLASSMNVEVCSVYVHEEKDDELTLAATCGLNKTSVGKVKMKAGEGLTGFSFAERKILNLANPDQHPKYKYFQSTGEEKFKTFLSVPLTAGGRCVGVLAFQSTKAERHPHAVVDMVKTLSTQLANLVLNAKMLQAFNKKSEPKAKTDQKDYSRQVMLRGIAANDGITSGQAFLFRTHKNFEDIYHSNHKDLAKEVNLFEKALEVTKGQTIELEKKALSLISEIDASIFNVHLMILEDKSFIEEIRTEIVKQGHSIEFSVKSVFSKYHAFFNKMDDPVFKEKEMDIKDVLLRLIEVTRNLRQGKVSLNESSANLSRENLILIAEELLPSDLIRMPIDNVAGIICEKGGVTAHVAILAKALDIPALLGVKELTKHVKPNNEILLDCHAEIMYIRPTEQVKVHFKQVTEAGIQLQSEPDSEPAISKDNKAVTLRANISLICETSLLKQYGAQGIGLYRTEFLYMIRDSLPTEDAQYNVFKKILSEAEGESVSIRVLDSGGDKPLPYISFPKEDNPALGNRGIRLLLNRKDIFKTQLRAILRAGIFGKLKILFPMITSPQEIVYIRQVLSEVETDLHANNIEHTEDYEIGIMVEVPSIVFGLEKIINQVDYVSIGSNDLLQYSFAIDRGNEQVSNLYHSLNPVFLGILKQIGEIMSKYPEKKLTLCGEMAGDVLSVPFILGAGIYDLSMSPRQIPSIKKVVRSFSIKECQELLNEAVTMTNPEAVTYLIKEKFIDKGLNGII